MKKYHVPATPCQRLLRDGGVSDACQAQLRWTSSSLDPVQLLNRIRSAHNASRKRKWAARVTLPQKYSRDLAQFKQSMSTAWRDGEVLATYRRPITGPRYWRTRVDPFETAWPLVQEWLDDQADINAKSLFQGLQETMTEPFQTGQLRTLQRRIKERRAPASAANLYSAAMELSRNRTAGKGRGHIVMEALVRLADPQHLSLSRHPSARKTGANLFAPVWSGTIVSAQGASLCCFTLC